MLISGQPISTSPISSEGIFFIEGTLEVFLFNLNINRSQNFTLKTAY